MIHLLLVQIRYIYTCCSIGFDETVATLFRSIGTTPSSELHLRSEVSMLEPRDLQLYFLPRIIWKQFNQTTCVPSYPQLQLRKFLKNKSSVGENNRCIPPNPRRVGYIVPIHGPLYMGSHIHQQLGWILSCQPSSPLVFRCVHSNIVRWFCSANSYSSSAPDFIHSKPSFF